MFSFDTSFYVYIVIITLFVLAALHMWRKLYNVNNHCKILENKLKTLKRENNDLQKALTEDGMHKNTMSDADFVMNQIFNVEPKDIPNMPNPDMFACADGKCSIVGKIPEHLEDISISSPSDHSTVPITPIVTGVQDIPGVKDVSDVPDVPEVSDVPIIHEIIEEIMVDVVTPVDKEIPVVKDEDVHESVGNNVYNRKKLSKLNLDKLKEIAVSMSISTDGTKNNIIDRILSQ